MCYEVFCICMQGSEPKLSEVHGKDPFKPESLKSKEVPPGTAQSVHRGLLRLCCCDVVHSYCFSKSFL